MINLEYAKKYCKDDISLIENYEKAIADSNQTWDCHHRREITTPRKELLELGEYYNRPAEELVFLTPFEHMSLHNKGKQYRLGKVHSEETRRKISEKQKNMSEETKIKISIARKGRHLPEEAKRKLSEAMKYKNIGRCWFNNGIKNVFAKSCPEGFVKGMLKRKKYEKRK